MHTKLKTLQPLYAKHCACCNKQIAISFSPLDKPSVAEPKLYCVYCARLIAQFSERFEVKRFDVKMIKIPYGGDRPGTLTYYVTDTFFKTQDYFNNNLHPINKIALKTSIADQRDLS